MPSRLVYCLAVSILLGTHSTSPAGFIRHDVPAVEYEQLALNPHFAAAGYIFHESIGFWHSGVLVTPNTVLTAAHAFDPDFTGSITRPTDEIYFGTSPNPFDGPVYKVTSIQLNPAWPTRPAEHDLALLKLERPVEGITPARIRAINPLGKVGVSVGYGLQGDGLNQELVGTSWRLAYEATIDYVGPEDGRVTEAVGAPPEEAANFGTTIRSDFDHPDGTTNTYGTAWPRRLEGGSATGDSGGPLFVSSDTHDEWFVVGILFGGVNPYHPDDDDDGYGNISLWSPLFSTTNLDFLRTNDVPVVPEPSAIALLFVSLLTAAVTTATRRTRFLAARS
jgi:hypothetical protein